MNNPVPTQRFSDRVENYLKYRPGYPAALYVFMRKEFSLSAPSRIADLGSGTALLSQLFLKKGHPVWGSEPNREMRLAAETLLASEKNFVSLDGTVEDIPLPDNSMDLVVAGQAFHWFEPDATRRACLRVLKPPACAALIWNDWSPALSPFLKDYDSLLIRYGTDYRKVSRQNKVTLKNIPLFFGNSSFRIEEFPHRQIFDLDGLRGRLLSSSYVPLEDHPNYQAMLSSLDALFEKYQQKGQLQFDYQARVYYGSLLS